MGLLDAVIDRFRTEARDCPYECLQCGVYLDLEYYVCPNCESFSIDRRRRVAL